MSRKEWERAPEGEPIDFELFPRNPADGETAFRGRRRQRVSVVPLLPSEADAETSYWVSWYEQWRRLSQPGFALLTASWTVYRGIRAHPDKTQLVRADWDQLSYKDASKDAGQPHWHFDQPVAVSIAFPSTPPTSTLREVQPLYVNSLTSGQAASGEATIGHVHLAMGTWNGNQCHPRCWQREARTCREIYDWAIRTLEYLQAQFQRR
jgi:hypothetical protein